MQASWLCTSPNSFFIFEAGFPCRTMISWNSGTRHVQLHTANQLGCPLPVQQATARIHLQAVDSSREKELSVISSSKRRGAGLALRRTDNMLTSLESAFTSLTSIGSHHTFSGSVILFMGTSLSKPRELSPNESSKRKKNWMLRSSPRTDWRPESDRSRLSMRSSDTPTWKNWPSSRKTSSERKNCCRSASRNATSRSTQLSTRR